MRHRQGVLHPEVQLGVLHPGVRLWGATPWGSNWGCCTQGCGYRMRHPFGGGRGGGTEQNIAQPGKSLNTMPVHSTLMARQKDGKRIGFLKTNGQPLEQMELQELLPGHQLFIVEVQPNDHSCHFLFVGLPATHSLWLLNVGDHFHGLKNPLLVFETYCRFYCCC